MIQGLCYICGRPAMHVCSICGNPVCDEHYVHNLRACSSCASKIGHRDVDIPPELEPKKFR